jgi:hypothetical protein
MMTLDLPQPVAGYFAAVESDDFEALARCFAADGIVRDERRTIIGPAEIRDWMAEAKRKYRHRTSPSAVVHRDGSIVVTARVAGDFPGSPITLEHIFRVVGGKIAELEIR